MTVSGAPKSPSKKKGEDTESKINDILENVGQAVKMDVDCSKIVEEKIPEAKKLAKDKKLNEALDLLLNLEKQTRTGSDMHSTSKVLVAIVQLCYEAKDWDLLNENIIQLTKKRGQLKASVTKMVQECCGWVFDGSIKSKEEELRLIETLRTVTAGKIYVEVERARLTHKLAKMFEKDGELEKAAATMHELQVETYGSMDKQEKVELILEQMRFCLATKDYIRTQIISKKISVRFFDKDQHQDLKLRYYQYMIELDQHEAAYLNICRHYRAIYETPSVREDEAEKLRILKHVALFVILAPFSNEQSDLIHRILEDKSLNDIKLYKNLLEKFTTPELIEQKLIESHSKDLRRAKGCTQVFKESSEEGRKRWEDLKLRVVEHNIRIMSKYYKRITLTRMATMLGLSRSAAEESLNAMVVDKTIQAKIDRFDGIVDFQTATDPNQLLNDWSHNITNLMGLVMKTTHLINKEEMVHKCMGRKQPQADEN